MQSGIFVACRCSLLLSLVSCHLSTVDQSNKITNRQNTHLCLLSLRKERRSYNISQYQRKKNKVFQLHKMISNLKIDFRLKCFYELAEASLWKWNQHEPLCTFQMPHISSCQRNKKHQHKGIDCIIQWSALWIHCQSCESSCFQH